MALGVEVGLGPCHIVLDGDKWGSSLPGDIVLDGESASPTEKGTAALATFRPMSVNRGEAVDHLNNC